MSPELEQELKVAVQQVQTAAMVLQRFAQGPAFLAMVEQEVVHAVRQAESPFVNRQAAADRWFKSLTEIDRAVASGILTKHGAGGTPLFEKAEGDAAIREGRWVTEAQKKARQRGGEPRGEPKGEHSTSNIQHPTSNQ